MFGPRQVFQSRLRCTVTQSRPISWSIVRGSRHSSTTTQEVTSRSSRFPQWFLYAGVFGGLGVAAGAWMDEKVAAPVLPGTQEDERRLDQIRQTFEHSLPIVKELRNDPDYKEANTIYGNYLDQHKTQRLTSGPLRGSRGLAFQRVFWNGKDKKAVNVIFLGSGIEGWPTVVHGGALATILDEHLARVGIQNLPERTGVTANLDIKYRAPVYSGNFYSVHATLDQERSTDRKAYVKGEVRDLVGRLVVEATALFVVPKGYKLQRIGDRF